MDMILKFIIKKMIEITKLKLDKLIGDDVIIKSWQEKNKSLVDAMKMERIAAIIILGLIFLVASFNLSSSLILLSIRKMKEVGMVRVLGAPKKELMTVVVLFRNKNSYERCTFWILYSIINHFFSKCIFIYPITFKNIFY